VSAPERYGRAPWPRPDELDAEQRAYYDELVASPRHREEIMDDQGRLRGPFNARLLDPAVGRATQAEGAALRFNSTLTDRERELAILTVARHENSAFEWQAHLAVGLRVGLTEGEVASIGASTSAWLTDDGERECVDLTRELLETHDLTDASFERGVETVGMAKVFDIISIVGHYQHTALALRVWRVPADDES
jgi:4-carboxymuconolactone decarboxylase